MPRVKKKPGPKREIENRGRPPKYPWDAWTDGEWHTVRWNRYTQSHESLRMALYQHASREGRKVQVQMTSESKTSFQFFDEDA